MTDAQSLRWLGYAFLSGAASALIGLLAAGQALRLADAWGRG